MIEFPCYPIRTQTCPLSPDSPLSFLKKGITLAAEQHLPPIAAKCEGTYPRTSLNPSLFDDHTRPAVNVGLRAVLYAAKEVEETLGDRARLVAEDIALTGLYIIDA